MVDHRRPRPQARDVSPSARQTTLSSRSATTSACGSPVARQEDDRVADRGGKPGDLDRHADHLGDAALALWAAPPAAPARAGRQAARSSSVSRVRRAPRRTCRTRLERAGPVARRARRRRSPPLPPRLHRRIGHHRDIAAEVDVTEGVESAGCSRTVAGLPALVERERPVDGVAHRIGRELRLATPATPRGGRRRAAARPPGSRRRSRPTVSLHRGRRRHSRAATRIR